MGAPKTAEIIRKYFLKDAASYLASHPNGTTPRAYARLVNIDEPTSVRTLGMLVEQGMAKIQNNRFVSAGNQQPAERKPASIEKRRQEDFIKYVCTHPDGASVDNCADLFRISYQHAQTIVAAVYDSTENIRRRKKGKRFIYFISDGQQDENSAAERAPRQDKKPARKGMPDDKLLGVLKFLYDGGQKLITGTHLFGEPLGLEKEEVAEMKDRRLIRLLGSGYYERTGEGETEYRRLLEELTNL